MSRVLSLDKLQTQLNEFIEVLMRDDRLIKQSENNSRSTLEQALKIYCSEARVALDMIFPYLDSNVKILEVGSGPCILTVFLANQDFNISGVEPSEEAFSEICLLKERIVSLYSSYEFCLYDQRIEDLIAPSNQQFDVIFSLNVMEHIAKPKQAISRMISLLSKNGRMIHSCPNYAVPYEPHFGIVVFQWFPSLSYLIWRKKIRRNIELWKSLNFISVRGLSKMVKECGGEIEFRRGTAFLAFERLGQDATFRERHTAGALPLLYGVLSKLRILKALRFLPVSLSTPMIFKVGRAE